MSVRHSSCTIKEHLDQPRKWQPESRSRNGAWLQSSCPPIGKIEEVRNLRPNDLPNGLADGILADTSPIHLLPKFNSECLSNRATRKTGGSCLSYLFGDKRISETEASVYFRT